MAKSARSGEWQIKCYKRFRVYHLKLDILHVWAIGYIRVFYYR